MIVNPKEFNYRVTIGILVVTMVAFAAYGFSSYSTLKSSKDFLVQEKRHLHNELSEIINRYDELNSENLNLKSQLDSTSYKVRVTNNAIKKLEAKADFSATIQNELKFLKTQKRSLEDREDSLVRVNQKIEEEKQKVIDELNFQKATALNEKEELESKLDNASLVSANSFVIKAYKLNKSDKAIQTFKAKDVDQLELCFVLAENTLASPEAKNIYIQIIDPDNNVVSDKGAVSFGDESLIFSESQKVYYSNKALDICLTVSNENAFSAGHYYVNVYEDNRRLGSTQIELN